MGAEVEVAHRSLRIEHRVQRAGQVAHRRDLVDVGPHRPRHGAVVCLGRQHEGAVVGLDGLVGAHPREDQLPAAAVTPVVRLRLPDRDPHVVLRDLVVHPHRSAPRGDALEGVEVGVARVVVLEERDAEALHPVEVLAPELHLGVALRHREHLAVGADDARIAHPAALHRVEDGGKELRGGGRPELVVDDDRERLVRADQLGEAGTAGRAFERHRRGGGDVGQGRGLVRLQPRPQIASWNPEKELLAIDGARVVARTDGERVERLVRDIDGDRIVQRSGSSRCGLGSHRHVEACRTVPVNSRAVDESGDAADAIPTSAYSDRFRHLFHIGSLESGRIRIRSFSRH